jgi:hypothetical protein
VSGKNRLQIGYLINSFNFFDDAFSILKFNEKYSGNTKNKGHRYFKEVYSNRERN